MQQPVVALGAHNLYYHLLSQSSVLLAQVLPLGVHLSLCLWNLHHLLVSETL